MAPPFQIELECPGCGQRRSLSPLEGAARSCEACDHLVEPLTTEALLDRRHLERCVACGEFRLYRQKSFNRRLGLLVVIGGVAASLAVLPISPLAAYGVLFGMAIVDAVLYGLLPEVAICYRCKATHRGYHRSSRPDPFDLLTAELIDHQVRESSGTRGGRRT